jgi:hypothetical protein
MAAVGGFVNIEFDVFAQKPVQDAVLQTTETEYKPIASVDIGDLEFVIPGIMTRTWTSTSNFLFAVN